jgi:hypothetical protein
MAGFVGESYFPIWNAGSASHDTNSGPGCSLEAFTSVAGASNLANFMDANGGPILAVTDGSVTITNSGTGKVRLTFAANALTNVIDGTYCYINFDAGVAYADGYYELHKSNNTTALIQYKSTGFLEYIADSHVDAIYIGGAFKTQTGFQTADVGGSATQNHMVYIRGDETVTASVVFAKCGERDNNKWTKYIGVDASWVPLTQGNYACIYGNQDSGQAMHDDHLCEITSTTAENMRFENLRFENTGADSADAATAMCFNKGNASLGGHVLKNCYFKRGYDGYGYTTASFSDALINCVAEDCRTRGIFASTGSIINGCYVFATGGCTLTNSYGIYAGSLSTVRNCVVANLVNTTGKEISYGIWGDGRQLVENNSLYGILTRGITIAGYGVVCRNNIIHVKTPGTSDAIYGTGSPYIELYNITNDTFANSGFVAGSGSVSDLAITATDPWINAVAGDFRLNRTGMALSNVIDCGFVPYCPSSIAGKTSIGAYSVGDIPLVESVHSTDSVMGTAGTGGTGDYPDGANVLSLDTVNGVAGTFVEADRNTDPGVANVLTGAGTYKICNATKTPTYHAPDAAEVINTAVFGPGSATPGTFDEAARNTDPGAANVLDSVVSYKIRGSTMAPIYHAPDPSEVWNTATFGADGLTAGTKRASSLANCSAGNIKSGVAIDDVTGSYGGAPVTPTLSITLAGTTATATITAAVGVTINLYQKSTTGSAWVLAGTRTGSGTITVTGLSSAMQYVFVAIDQTGGVNSFPSNPVVVETASGFVGEMMGFQTDGLAFMLAACGEEIDFYPPGGGTRSILALVDRLGSQDVPGAPEGMTEVFRIVVPNDPAEGISSTEVNCRVSKIGVARRPGLAKVERTVWQIENQDEAGMSLLAG